MKSVMQHRFSEVPSVELPRSQFDRSHGYKTTFDAGYLIPILIDEVLPGDTFNLNMAGFARLATPYFPLMDNMVMDTFFFEVPCRLLWDNFKKAMGEQANPGDSIDYTVPVIDDINNIANESLADYFGIPTQVAANQEVNAMPFRAYNLIWNEWFRDQNLQDSLPVNTDQGPDNIADYTLQRRCKRHDYFTSCLPWLQKGDAVQLSLGTTAPVVGKGTDSVGITDGTSLGWLSTTDGSVLRSNVTQTVGTLRWAEQTGMEVDLTGATASTVNELRQAVQIQRLLEKNARSGSRYTEIIQSHFGVTSPDARQQRPVYLGGGSTPVSIAPVSRTDSTPGEVGGLGTTHFANHGFSKSFTEHGYVIGLICVRADLTYQEGIEKLWSRSTRYDFYWPTLAHLGEQAVLNKEIYVDAATIGDDSQNDVFGYQERYAELRYKPSKITGKMRSNDALSLDPWHLSIEFGGQPTLDSTFIQENPPLDRVIRVPSEPHFIFDSYFKYQCTRPLPVYSVPGFIDHF